MKRAVLLAGALLLALTGCSGGGAGRPVPLEAHDYAYAGLETFVGRAGEKVQFAMTNIGPADHELEVFGPDGKAVGEVGPTAAGDTKKATLMLGRPGTYRFRCGISDHESRGMVGTFEVR